MNLHFQSSVIFVIALVGVSQADDVYQLPEYTVMARHFEQEVLDVPSDVVRIDRDIIDRSVAASLPDLLAVEANLYFRTISGSTNVSMRGFGEGSGLRSLILVDGQPLNPADMGKINWELVPLHSIESVEVLRGGHNVLYGDKALAGVIKIETRRTGESSLSLQGRLASDNTHRASVDGSIGYRNWSIRAGGYNEETDGYRDNSASETRSAYVNTGYTFDSGDDLDLHFSTGETDLVYPGGLSYEEYKDDPTQSLNLGDEGSETSYVSLTARAQGQRDWGSWELLTGYDSMDIDWSFGAGSYGKNEQGGFSFKPRARLKGEPVAIVGGFDLLYDELDFTRYLDEARTIVPNEAELNERRLSPYALLEVEPVDQLTVSGGMRYEWVRYEVDSYTYDPNQIRPFLETNRGTFVNQAYKNPADVISYDADVIHEEGAAYEFSLNYRVGTHWSLWFGYDRVYRYPVFDERAAYQGVVLAEAINQDLEAEEGDNYELGAKFIKGAHELYVTGFLLKMENEIAFVPDAEGSNPLGMGLNVNLGPVDRHGVDIAYFYDADAWGASTRLAWVQTEIRSGEGRGEEVPLVPEWVVTNRLWWKPFERLSIAGIHQYIGEQYQGGDFTNSERKVDDYHLFDVNTELQVAKQIRVFASIENVLDETYTEAVYSGSYYPGAGRYYTIGAKLDF